MCALIAEVEEYCRQKQGPYMEDKVSSTCKVELTDTPRESNTVSHSQKILKINDWREFCWFLAIILRFHFLKLLSQAPTYPAELLPHLPTSAFSPPPMKATPTAPTIFRPPGLEESEEEAEEADEPTEGGVQGYPSALCTPFPPVSAYPSMLRLLNPHLYRNHLSLYHPYFPHRYYHHSKWNGTIVLNFLVGQINDFLSHIHIWYTRWYFIDWDNWPKHSQSITHFRSQNYLKI